MKDYAKKNTYRAKANEREAGSSHDRWLIAFIIITLCLAALSALHTLYKKRLLEKQQAAQIAESEQPAKTPIEKKFKKATPKQHHVISEKAKQAAVTTKAKTQDTAPADNEPKYDFYQLLPKMTVDVPTGQSK